MQLQASLRSFAGKLIRYSSNFVDCPAVVLIYHRVTNLNQDPQLLTVKPENFHQQIEYLKKNYNVLTIEAFREILKAGNGFPQKSLMITFDDGYADNYFEALPILEEFDVQALFYITTSLVGTQKEFWWDDLERIFLTGAPSLNS